MTKYRLFLSLAAVALSPLACGGPGAGPAPRVPSPAELAALGPEKAADALTLASAGADFGALSAAIVAAGTCPAGDAACRVERQREALEAFATSGAALELLVALQHELAGPSGPKAAPPDEARVCRLLRLAPCELSK